MIAVKPDFVGIDKATPGYFVLETGGDDNGYPTEVLKRPVLEWAFEKDTYVPYPITLDGVQYDNVHIMQPDGTIERPCIDWCPSVDEWLKDRQNEYAKTKVRK